MIGAAAVEEEDWRAAESTEDDVHPAVVIDVSEGGTARSQLRGHAGISALKATVMIKRKQRQLFVAQGSVNLLDIVQHVALRHEKILPAIIVEVFKAHTPAGTARGQGAQAGFKTLVAEGAG